jgi:hypothetical protein
MRSHRASMVLFLGIFGLMCCSPLSFVAFFLGRHDLAEIDAGRMDPSGRSLTNFGRILGIVGMIVFAVYLVYLALNWDSLSTQV